MTEDHPNRQESELLSDVPVLSALRQVSAWEPASETEWALASVSAWDSASGKVREKALQAVAAL